MKRITCPVRSIEFFNHDTRCILLELPEDVSFRAGQYLEMVLPEKNCPFSIASSPDRKDVIELHIRPTPDSDDSIEIEKLLNSHPEQISIDFPKGDCFVTEAPDNPTILIAASTGVTQMNSIIEFLLPTGFVNPLYLYWGVVADKDLYLNDRYVELDSQYDNFHYIPVVSEPETSPEWQGRSGLVGQIALEDFDDLSAIQVYVSGGPGMVYATLDAFVGRGLPGQNMYSDVFSYAPRS